jgi:hypothetical protein
MDFVRSVRARVNEALCRLKWELGQTTAEYALVLLAAAAIAIVLIKWAQDNPDLEEFFKGVIQQIKQNAGIGGSGGNG